MFARGCAFEKMLSCKNLLLSLRKYNIEDYGFNFSRFTLLLTVLWGLNVIRVPLLTREAENRQLASSSLCHQGLFLIVNILSIALCETHPHPSNHILHSRKLMVSRIYNVLVGDTALVLLGVDAVGNQ